MKHMKEKNFRNVESLQFVINILNDAYLLLGEKEKEHIKSRISELKAGALGYGTGTMCSLAILSRLGIKGLSTGGVASGLTVAGETVKGGMLAGMFVMSLPAVICTGAGVCISKYVLSEQLKGEEYCIYTEIWEVLYSFERGLIQKDEVEEEKNIHIEALILMLRRILADIKDDLGL